MSSEPYRAKRDLPWTPAMLAAAAGLNGTGLLLILAGWYGASGQAALTNTVPWANVSAAGLAVAAVGNSVVLAGGRSRVGARYRLMAHDRMQRKLTQAQLAAEVGLADAVGLDGQTLRHRPECSLVAGKSAHTLSSREALRRSACGWCKP